MNPIRILLVEDSEGDVLLITEALEEGRMGVITMIDDFWIQVVRLPGAPHGTR